MSVTVKKINRRCKYINNNGERYFHTTIGDANASDVDVWIFKQRGISEVREYQKPKNHEFFDTTYNAKDRE